MKLEIKTLIISAIANIFIAIIKLVGGVLCGVNALLVDSIYTFCNAGTDIISTVGTKISIKRPTKNHPFGFGRVEYLANLTISILLFAVGTVLLFNSFHISSEIPSLFSIVLVALAVLLKYISVSKLKKQNKKIKSSIIEEGIKEANIDILSSVLIAVVIILEQFKNEITIFKYSDLLVSIFIVLLIYKSAFGLLKHNILNIIGTVDNNDELKDYISDIITNEFNVSVAQIELIKYGRYYKAHIVLTLDGNITLKESDIIENKIKERLSKSKKIKIKIFNIESNAATVK